MKRLIIYFIYDKDGIVDDYIIYMLEELKINSTEIAVVCNGTMTEEAVQKLSGITDHVIIRENQGFDVWAYKTVLDRYGWNRICSFDEVVMMNYTIMGPVYPLREMFTQMEQKDVDFWGITKFHEYRDGDPFGTISYGYIPEHIQSHFIAVRNTMLSSMDYQEYWNQMCPIHNYKEAVGCHEAIFTKYFSDRGYRWDVYADMGEAYNNHPILCAAREMMELKRCPVFKRRSFMQDYGNILSDTAGQPGIEVYNYIDRYTDYDVNMIWDNILRLENMADIKKNLHLNYVLESRTGHDISRILQKKKLALVLHLYYEELAEYCLRYVKSMPEEADIYITVDSEQKKKFAEQIFGALPNTVTVILIENRGRDVSALLVGARAIIMDYDYVCFVHDKKVTQLQPETIGMGFSYKCFENLLSTRALVENIIHTFEDHPRLGMLMPPPPNHADYYITMGLEWGDNYDITKQLAEKLGLTVPLSEDKEPIAPLGTMFWFRPKALSILFEQNWQYQDFPKEPNKTDGTLLHAIERIYGYVVQQEGYYPGWIFSDVNAGMEITNLNYMIRELNKSIFLEGSGGGTHAEVISKLNRAFSEWRLDYCPVRIESGQIIETRLYLQQNGEYSEQNSQTAKNGRGNREYVFDQLEAYGSVSEVRWDPSEMPRIMVTDFRMEVCLQNGELLEMSLKNAWNNGIKIQGGAAFWDEDSQIYFRLPYAAVLKSIKIEAGLENIPKHKQDYLKRRRKRKEFLRSLKRKIK